MVLNEGMLMLADEPFTSKILKKLVFSNAFHYLAHRTNKRDRAVVVRIARAAFLKMEVMKDFNQTAGADTVLKTKRKEQCQRV
jgi:hypothetical protein